MHNFKAHGGLSFHAHQRGAVLIVSMVILLIMTLIGTANMQSAGLQQKMAANAKARQDAFQFAESALRFAETTLQARYNGGLSERDLILNCVSGGANCFEDTCRDGLCFLGQLDPGGDRSECSVSPLNAAAANATNAAFLNRNFWDTDGLHQKATGVLGGAIDNYVSEPKYIIEFMCYVKKDATQDCRVNSATGCSPLFRATALVERKGAAARVMLSSLFRL